MKKRKMKDNCYIIEKEISEGVKGSKRVFITLLLTIGICLLEFIGGIISGSNALIADAGHMLTDSASLFVCYFAALIAMRKADLRKTYGYFRIEILASMINGTLLIVLALFVIISAIRRYFEPIEVDGKIMLIVSIAGLVANIAGIYILREHTHNLNIRGAFLHIIGDTLSSLGVISGSIIIILTGFNLIDSILGIIIGLFIFYNAIRLIKDATDILMESVPHELKIEDIINELKSDIKGVKDIHDIHIWSISSGIYVLSAHIVTDVNTLTESDEIINKVKSLMNTKYNIAHTTIQIESTGFKRCE